MACDADKDVGFEQEKQPVIGSQAVDRASVANGLSSEVALNHVLVLGTVAGGTAEAFEQGAIGLFCRPPDDSVQLANGTVSDGTATVSPAERRRSTCSVADSDNGSSEK